LADRSVEKNSTNGGFRLHIYLRTNKTFILNSLYVFDNCGENLRLNNVAQLQYENIYRKGLADPDNQLPDKRSYCNLCLCPACLFVGFHLI